LLAAMERNGIRGSCMLSVRGEIRIPELFPNARNDAMTRAGFEYILRKHVHTLRRAVQRSHRSMFRHMS